MKRDVINPAHYRGGNLEAIDVIESFALNYRLGSATKYILRAGKKGPAAIDIRKAIWFLQRELSHLTPKKKRFKSVRHP